MTTLPLKPRFTQALTSLPENNDTWKILLDQSDNFAFKTAIDQKGGPFGAQLWLYNPEKKQLVLVGEEDSNAVVSKGIASAHAEAERKEGMPHGDQHTIGRYPAEVRLEQERHPLFE